MQCHDSNERETGAQWTRSIFNATRRRVSVESGDASLSRQKRRPHVLALPLERFGYLVFCSNLFGMQITRRCKRRFDETVRRRSLYISPNLGRRRHLYVCSCCGMPIESWPK